MRYAAYLSIAAFIDFIQMGITYGCLALGAALQSITPVGGAAGGAAAGAYYCWDASAGVWTAVAAAAKCAAGGAVIGGATSAFGLEVGAVLGIAINICITVTAGLGFIVFLIFDDLFYKPVAWGVVYKLIPFIGGLAPGWFVMTLRCVARKEAEEGSGITAVFGGLALAGVAASQGDVRGVVGNSPRAAGAAQTSFSPVAANDNRSQNQGRTSSIGLQDIRVKPAANNNRP